MSERRGFWVFDVTNGYDETCVANALHEAGLPNVRVEEREREQERIYVTYDHDKPLPVNIRDILNAKGVVC